MAETTRGERFYGKKSDGSKAPAEPEGTQGRHARERKEMHERHKSERDDMHKRHEKDHADMAERHDAELMADSQTAPVQNAPVAPTAPAAAPAGAPAPAAA